MYTCDKCEKVFDYESLLKKHKLRKTPCITCDDYNKKIQTIENIIKTNTEQSLKSKDKCYFCNKSYLNISNLKKHINRVCFERKNLEDNKLKLIQERDRQEKEIEKLKLIDEMNKLRKDIAKLLDKQSIQNITINNNTQNNLIININSFGKEDLSHITNTDYKNFFNGFFPGFIKYIQKTHFDEHVPQNHNICITNIKSKYIYVYENGNWQLKERDYIIDKLITKKYVMLTDKFDELEENNEIDKKTIENFNEFMENYDDNEAQKNTKNDVILMIYNNKDKLKNKP